MQPRRVAPLCPLPTAPRGSSSPPGAQFELPTPCRNLQPPSLVCAQSRFLSPRLCLHFQATASSCAVTTTATSTSRRPSPSHWPSLFHCPAGGTQQQELSSELTTMQVSRLELAMAKKVAWITRAQELLLQPRRSAQKSRLLLPTGGCYAAFGLGEPRGAFLCSGTRHRPGAHTRSKP